MIGQESLLAHISDMIAEDRLPRFSIVACEKGMMPEQVAYFIGNSLNANIIVLPDVKIDTIRDMINQAYKLHNTTIYCIKDADNMSVNAKNALLKVVEEAPNRAYFVMCLEDTDNTLATIESRAIVFRLRTPTKKEIRDFARSIYAGTEEGSDEKLDIIANICTNEGDVTTLTKMGTLDFYKFVQDVAENITTMDGAEAFNITNKLALKDEEDKYDIGLFLKALQFVFWEKCRRGFSQNPCNAYCSCSIARCIGRCRSDLRIKGINKGMLIDMMILEMRKIWKSQM